jgi:lysophospholipase L1-like esterase
VKGRLALLSATLLLCVAAGEIALRVAGFGQPLIHNYDPELLWKLPPHSVAYAPSYGVSYRTNARGWRDDEIAAERSPDEIRILALGDSILFGQGVPFEETFSERLEAILAEATGERVEVINTGISGYGVLQYRVVLEKALPVYRPDLVLVLLAKNDVLSERDVEELRQNALDGRQDNVDTPRIRARRASALFHAVDGLALRLGLLGSSPRALHYDPGGIASEAWSYTLAELERMLRDLDEGGIPLVVVTVPLAREVRDGRIEVGLEPLEELAAARGFHLVSLWPAFSARRGETLFLDDVHPSSPGHAVAAEVAAAYLLEHHLLFDPAPPARGQIHRPPAPGPGTATSHPPARPSE